MIEKDGIHASVIMAGGAGERFWPLSRRSKPKQLLPLNTPDKSMLLEAVERAAALSDAENTYIVTGEHLVTPIRNAGLPLPPDNVLAEPCKRNTTGALAYITAHLLARHHELTPDDIGLAVLTADHRIDNLEAFLRTARAAMRVADTEPALVTCGIKPTRPATGFGYIESEPDTQMEVEGAIFRVRAFHEKPDAEQARTFVASNRFLWNSGMFFWRLSTFLEEMGRARPDVVEIIEGMTKALHAGDGDAVKRLFASLEDISIDYALMEHARNIMVVKGDFPWADVGSWTALRRDDNTDKDGNLLRGDPVAIACENSIVVNAAGAKKMAVGVLGLSNATVVVTEDAVLVMDSTRAEEVRHIVSALKERGADQL